MKKIIYFLFILNTFFFANLCKANIRYIDVNFILQNSDDGKKIINELNILKKKNEDLFKSRYDNLEKEKKNLKKIKNVINEDDYKKEIIRLKENIEKYDLFKKNQILSFEKLKTLRLDNFFLSLNEILANYINENNINIIIDKKNIVIAEQSLDISKEILNIINNRTINE